MDEHEREAEMVLKAKATKRASERAAAQVAALVLDSPDASSDNKLREAILRIRVEKPGLVAKQVYEELLAIGGFENTTVSEVKRMCSKVAKADVAEKTGQAGPWQHLLPTLASPKSKHDLARDIMQDPLSRDADTFKMSRPGLPTQGTTLQRGDRLGTAAERGDTQQVLKLLKKGVDPNFQNGASGVTPLGVACERGHIGVVRALLDARANPEIATREGYRPVHIAAQFGKADILEMLMRRGKADASARCPLQDTFPLLLAVNFDFQPCIHVLLAGYATSRRRPSDTGKL